MRRERVLDLAIAVVALTLTLALLASGGVGPGEEAQREPDPLAIVLAALSTLPLALWRVAPLAVYVATIVPNGVMNALAYPDGPPFGPAIALYLLVAARPPTRTTVAVVVALFTAHFLVLGLARGEFPTAQLLLGTSLWLAISFVADRVRLRRERMVELEERARRAEREAERERRLAAAEERMRIARDLHDSAGHAINVILVQAGAARLLQERDPAAAREALDTIEEVARDTLGEIDQLVHALREDGSGEVEPRPGLAALETLVERHRRAGLDVAVEVGGSPRELPPPVGRAAYRILQEALTNAARHGAGGAAVEIAFGGDALEISVRNPLGRDGGGSATGGGHGLVGMRERAALLGGSVEAAPADGVFSLRARLPYRGGEGK